MNSYTKMTLTPIRQAIEQQAVIDHVSQLDKEMTSILHSNSPDDVKIKLYMSVLRAHDKAVDAPVEGVHVLPPPNPPTSPPKSDPVAVDLLKNIPKRKKAAANALVVRMQDKHVTSGEHGELVISGRSVADTNVRVLFEYCIRDVKRVEPTGWTQFIHAVGRDVIMNRMLKPSTQRWYSLY